MENIKRKLFSLVSDEKKLLAFERDSVAFNVEFHSIEMLIDEHPDKIKMIPLLLEFIEKYPRIDYGFPGNICHLLERMGNEYDKFIMRFIKNYRSKYIWRVLYFRICNDFIDSLKSKEAYENIKFAQEKGILDEDDVYDILLDLEENIIK